jgi:hypothetical protein
VGEFIDQLSDQQLHEKYSSPLRQSWLREIVNLRMWQKKSGASAHFCLILLEIFFAPGYIYV